MIHPELVFKFVIGARAGTALRRNIQPEALSPNNILDVMNR